MATLSLFNNFTLTTDGAVFFGKQGLTTDDIADAYESLAVDGLCHMVKGSLATAAVVTLWDEEDDVPADFDYGFIWADQTYCVQVIGTATEFRIQCAANCPFVIPGFDNIVCSAGTSVISGGTEPTWTAIDSVVLGNYSGSTMKYVAAFID